MFHGLPLRGRLSKEVSPSMASGYRSGRGNRPKGRYHSGELPTGFGPERLRATRLLYWYPRKSARRFLSAHGTKEAPCGLPNGAFATNGKKPYKSREERSRKFGGIFTDSILKDRTYSGIVYFVARHSYTGGGGQALPPVWRGGNGGGGCPDGGYLPQRFL